MRSLTTRISAVLEISLSMIGAALLIFQTVSGVDGVAQIAAALVALIAPVCSAIRATSGGSVGEVAEAVADAVTDTLRGTDTSA